jgi:hypothetical protein
MRVYFQNRLVEPAERADIGFIDLPSIVMHTYHVRQSSFEAPRCVVRRRHHADLQPSSQRYPEAAQCVVTAYRKVPFGVDEGSLSVTLS